MNRFMKMAIEEATEGITHGHGGPFGCVIVKDGDVIGRGHNEVLKQNDPTCHGEIMAIRDACRTLGSYDLKDCELYTTAEPCPMCRGAILWSNITKIYYGCRVADTAEIGFRDDAFYNAPVYNAEETDREECLKLFGKYTSMKDRKIY